MRVVGTQSDLSFFINGCKIFVQVSRDKILVVFLEQIVMEKIQR